MLFITQSDISSLSMLSRKPSTNFQVLLPSDAEPCLAAVNGCIAGYSLKTEKETKKLR